MEIQRLIWDAWNIAHIARHDVSPQEVEEACGNEEHVVREAKLGRMMLIGSTNGRVLP